MSRVHTAKRTRFVQLPYVHVHGWMRGVHRVNVHNDAPFERAYARARDL